MRRPEKVAELVREEIVQIVGYALEDPRLVGVTVSDVRMSENLREARIYVMFAGGDEEAAPALRALNNAAPYVRRQLAMELSLRHAPQLFFIRDTAGEKAARVAMLLEEITPGDTAPPPVGEAAVQETGEASDE